MASPSPLRDEDNDTTPLIDDANHHATGAEATELPGVAAKQKIEEWNAKGYHCRTFLTILFVSFIVFASAKTDNSGWMIIVEYINTAVLCAAYVVTSIGTVLFIATSEVKNVAIGTRTEHLTASIMGLIIFGSSIAKLVWDPEVTGCRKLIESHTIIIFTVSNVIYVWFHNNIDNLNKWAYAHQTLHFALSLTLAFTAEFLEVQEIVRHFDHMNLTMEYEVYDAKYGKSAEEHLESLGSFLFSLNFEFHFLLANYAYLISKKPGMIDNGPRKKFIDFCKSRDTKIAILLLFLTIAFLSLYFFVEGVKYAYKHIAVAYGIVVVLGLVLVSSGILYLLCKEELKEPTNEENKHENNVILWAAYGLLFSTIGGIPYSIQALLNSKSDNSHESATSLAANIISSLGIFTQTSVLRLYNERKAKENETDVEKKNRKKKTKWEKICITFLAFFNLLLFISNMLEVCQMGVHSSAPEPVVHVVWLIMYRALESVGVFYRLASFFRCIHYLTASEHDLPGETVHQQEPQRLEAGVLIS